MEVNDRIKKQLDTYPVLLYMKGTPDFPQCGFSAQTVAALRQVDAEFAYVNIFEDPEIRKVVGAIRETIKESSCSICVIAGADLAHVGRRFGDPTGPTENSLNEVGREDQHFLKLVEEGDAEGVFKSIAADNDRRRVCGYPPIYMTLRCLGRTEGKLLQYRQWSDLDAGAAVTYAALALF